MFYWKRLRRPLFQPLQGFFPLRLQHRCEPFLSLSLLNLIHTVKGYEASNIFLLKFYLMGLFLTILCMCNNGRSIPRRRLPLVCSCLIAAVCTLRTLGWSGLPFLWCYMSVTILASFNS